MSFALTSLLTRDISCFDVIKTIFALSDNEIEVLSCIHNMQPVSVNGITEIIPKDRTTISRAIHKLMSLGVVRKEKTNLKKGGYQFLYHSISMEELRKRISTLIDQITQNLHNSVEKLTKDKCKEKFFELKTKYTTLSK